MHASEVAPRRRSRLLQRSGCTHQLTGNLRRHVALKLTPRTRTQTRAAAHTTANLASDRAACDGACSRSLSRSSQATRIVCSTRCDRPAKRTPRVRRARRTRAPPRRHARLSVTRRHRRRHDRARRPQVLCVLRPLEAARRAPDRPSRQRPLAHVEWAQPRRRVVKRSAGRSAASPIVARLSTTRSDH